VYEDHQIIGPKNLSEKPTNNTKGMGLGAAE